MKSIQMVMDDMKTKRKECDELQHQLEISIAIQGLWKEAFDVGSISSNWFGNVYKEFQFILNRSDGESRTFSENEVPIEIYRTLPAQRVTYLQSIHRLRKTTSTNLK